MKIDKTKFFVACAKNKLTFLDAVKKAGLSRNIVVSINKGKNVNSKKVGLLAVALNCEPEEVILKDNSNCETKEYCLAENLKLFRDIKGISQKEVADYLGITQAAYSKYEVGETEPKIPTLIKLAKYFETDLNQLICSNHNKEILKGGENMKYYKHTQHSILHSMYCMIYACLYVYGKVIFDGLDWFGKKLVDLIDHSDFFAGCVTTAAVISIWELITR